MFGRHRFGTAARRAAALVAFAILLAGCASAEKNLTVPSTTSTSASSEQLKRHDGHEHGVELHH